jgi:ABC-type glycerol-3-phosphate transport system permease component
MATTKGIRPLAANRSHRRFKPAWLLSRCLTYAVVAAALVWTLFPFYCAFVLSIKVSGDFWTSKYIPFVQFRPTLAHWIQEWQNMFSPYGLGRGIGNSVIVASSATGLSLLLGLVTAYGLRIGRGKGLLAWPVLCFFLLPRFVAPMVVVIPFTMMMRWLGLADTRLAVICAHTTLALPLVLLFIYSAMVEIPDEFLDSARMDGCGELAVLFRILVPVLAPALLVAGVLAFAGSWSEFFFALLNTQQRAWTAPLSIASLITKDGIEFEWVGSHLLLVMLPPTLLVLVGYRSLARALTFGTVKG